MFWHAQMVGEWVIMVARRSEWGMALLSSNRPLHILGYMYRYNFRLVCRPEPLCAALPSLPVTIRGIQPIHDDLELSQRVRPAEPGAGPLTLPRPARRGCLTTDSMLPAG